ncbi:MAG: ABC transporter permease [Acidimicrobiales bacterium]
MLRWTMPIMLAGLGGLFAERSGVVNIGLEGMMILGTWFGAWGALNYGPWAGIALGMLGGAVGGLLHAIATVGFGVDHIISGVAINILAPGVTRFLSAEVFTGYQGGSITQSPGIGSVAKVTVPVLSGGKPFGWRSPDVLGHIEDYGWFFVSDVAGFLRGCTSQVSLFTLLSIALIPASAFVLWRTRFGLRLRIAGERPEAGESLGVDVIRYKYYGVVTSGALAGAGGAFIAMELTGFYRQGQTTERGYLGLAALIFGNWRPTGVGAGALLFGFPTSVSLRERNGTGTHALLLVIALVLLVMLVLSLRRGRRADAIIAAVCGGGALLWYLTTDTAPDWLPDSMPFAIVLLVLVFNSQRLRMPAALGQVYRKGET